MTTCIGCGCDDSQACVGRGGTPCSWIIVSERRLAGLCSECEQLVPPSRRQLEVDQAEASLEIYGDLVPQGMVLGMEYDRPPPAPRLILPGDPEFFL